MRQTVRRGLRLCTLTAAALAVTETAAQAPFPGGPAPTGSVMTHGPGTTMPGMAGYTPGVAPVMPYPAGQPGMMPPGMMQPGMLPPGMMAGPGVAQQPGMPQQPGMVQPSAQPTMQQGVASMVQQSAAPGAAPGDVMMPPGGPMFGWDAGLNPQTPDFSMEPRYQEYLDEALNDIYSCVCGPRTTFKVGTIVLWRDEPEQRTLVIDQTDQAPLLDSIDMEFDGEFGLLVEGTYRLNNSVRAQALYYGLQDYRDTIGVRGNNNLSLPGTLALGSFNYFAADGATAEYSSRIHNAELNAVYDRNDNFSVIAGFRYFKLDDVFTLTFADSDSSTTDYVTSVDNNLFAGQLGVESRRAIGRVQASSWLKGIVGGNNIENSQTVDDFPDFVLRDGDASKVQTSVGGEIGFELEFAVTRNLIVSGGYRALILGSIAEGPLNLEFDDVTDEFIDVAASESIFLHGAHGAVEVRW